MPRSATCQTVFPVLQKNALYFLACIALNEIFLLLGSHILKHRNSAYTEFTTREAVIYVGWLSGAGNFVVNAICRFIFYGMQHNEEQDDATPTHPGEMTLSHVECACYTMLHATGFPLFSTGAAYFMKFNKPFRAAAIIATGMVVMLSAMACLLCTLVAVCFGWERCERRTDILHHPVARLTNDPYHV